MNLILPFAAIFALAYLAMAPRPPGTLRSVTKTLAVALLAMAAALDHSPVWLIIALAMCALGDWLLSREGEAAFMGGIGAFAAGHLAYVALFLSHPSSDPSRLLQNPQLWIVAGFAILGVAMAMVIAPRAGVLKGAVLGYIPIILGMGVAALTVPGQEGPGQGGPGQGALVWVLPAALAFVASDIVLAFETFVLPADHPLTRITPYLIWPLYWGAQAGFLIAFA